MARTSLPISFATDGAPVGGETLVTEAGASVLVFTSTSPALRIEMRSAYLEGERRGSVLVAESAVVGGEPAALGSRLIAVGEEALTTERRALLYDHLQALQDLAEVRRVPARLRWRHRSRGLPGSAPVDLALAPCTRRRYVPGRALVGLLLKRMC